MCCGEIADEGAGDGQGGIGSFGKDFADYSLLH